MSDTNDRELLELAAKAVGIRIWFYGHEVRLLRNNVAAEIWNPLISDGDALRLAVSLNLTIRFDSLEDGPVVQVSMPWHDEFPDYWLDEWLHKDAARATRRAIVRAAALIGKAMA